MDYTIEAITRFVRWLCRKLTRDQLIIAISILLEVINDQREDMRPRNDFAEKHPHYRKFTVDPLAPLTEVDTIDLSRIHKHMSTVGLVLTYSVSFGLSNKDDQSEQFRPFKQLIERLNRTYKFHTRARAGFKTQQGAVALTALFVAHYNFLRPHGALRYNVPIRVPELHAPLTLQGQWLKLLQLAA